VPLFIKLPLICIERVCVWSWRLEVGLPLFFYSPSCREEVFSETRIQLGESSCVRTGAKRYIRPL
jgi:hypothetical protein